MSSCPETGQALHTAYTNGCRCDACVEHHRAYLRQWQKDNPDKMKRYRRKWLTKRPDYLREYGEQWRKDNPEYHHQYLQNHLSEHAANQSRRRARKLNALPDDDSAVREYEAFLRMAQSDLAKRGIESHVDHIVPLSRGGKHTVENLRLLTAEDNRRKHDRLDSECDFDIVPILA